MRQVLLHKGTAFEAQSGQTFAKDVLEVNSWHHPVSGEEVPMPRARLENLCRQSNRYLANKNTIPYPDGHAFESMANLGFWPGPWVMKESKLWGVVKPTDPEAEKKMRNGSIDAVSVVIRGPVTDPQHNTYDEVIVQCCATNYPVNTDQHRGFVALSSLTDDTKIEKVEMMLPGKKKITDKAQVALDAFADRVLEINGASLQGKPGRTFAECVRIIQGERGVDEEQASRICGALARRAGELDWSRARLVALACEDMAREALKGK